MDVRVPAAAVSADALVGLGTCPLHNHEPVRTRRRSFCTARPMWLRLLVLIALPIGVLVSMRVRSGIMGQVPECLSCVRDQKRFRRNLLFAWLLAVGMLLLTVDAEGRLNGFAFVAGLIVLAGASRGRRGRVIGVLTEDRLWVQLMHVDPHFASKADRVLVSGG